VVLKFIQKFTKKTQTDSQIETTKTPTKAPTKAPDKTIAAKAPSASTFEQLQLIDPILRAIKAEGYKSPSPIQRQAIPPVLAGKDLLGCAQTGTGKTAAFALPILQRLTEDPTRPSSPRVLVLAPTRELALQIGESFKSYGRNLPLKSVVVFGGVGLEPQISAIKRGVDIIVATPGRLLDLMDRRAVHFRSLSVLVLDEADRMLDMGFIHDLKRILKVLPAKRQNLLFSATIPREVQGLIDSILRSPVKVEVAPISSTSEQVEQRAYFVGRGDKRHLLLHILETDHVTRALVFTRTKHNANKLEKFLTESGIKAAAIHGNKSQNARQRALEGFRSGHVRILVASDIAARGIDIDAISHVINFEMPNEPETYVHRIGRTGRAEARGVAISFCDLEEQSYLRQVEKITRKKIPVVSDHPFTAGANAPVPPKPQRRGRHHSQRGPSNHGRPSSGGKPRSPARG
jgi:ATP-dependent RNA helicase RhlE